MNILGISAFYHDSAACLLRDGAFVAAAQEERFTRKKHDQDFPRRAVAYCLEEAGITIEDIDYIAFYDKPFLKFERILETYLSYVPRGIQSFLKAIPVWMKQKLWIKDIIAKELNYTGTILFPEHHESHAASAFFPSPFAEAAIITVDGVGEWATASYGIGEGNTIRIMADIQFPHSLGLLYSAFTYYTGFKVNAGEYKVMGLAPYGDPVYKDIIYKHLIDVKEDGSFALDMSYFNFGAGLTMTNNKFHDLFGGPPCVPESNLTQREMDLARSIQEVTEEIMLRIARHVHAVTGKKKLCLAGGVALNCVSNGRLLRESPFEDIWIQPAAGDAGGSVGAAYIAWYHYAGMNRRSNEENDAMNGSYLGPLFSSKAIEEFLIANSIPFHKLGARELLERVSKLLSDGNIVGWFQGRMEFGPRALGARSILGDARSPKMQSVMNLKIKFRESFRPFAPSVLKERARAYFSLEKESPYMLFTAVVNTERRTEMSEEERQLFGIDKLHTVRSDIPAVTHVDYSARIQTVDQKTNTLYHALLSQFEKDTGHGLLVNTSFNVRGEPIVCTPEDAYRCFMRTEMDYLVLGPYILDKKEQKRKTHYKQEEFALD
ncbi:MAG: hypothetical protein COU90_02055 [Candidatus Ryanbacteria bacterium CG10_big_fil_rev_8_21_14_0_10_43_42]|uniref:Carbamoyltransferase n=1 Tax=Candidatus Ryanbacteria bacterium CG10_big_fil_rev_8_21_14_0_10_43_42 TaxID=1974864 RepID=A0A2M8KXI1_9BACT|nr:MAG: hypothetical protein COU90_02055 [Candidatus Ryanbacteria bacterium CG10_big_fil_rev_8_21_14_0_10_43_42]